MPVYFVTGRLGSGKSLVAVRRIQEYLQKGLPVATNMDINLEYMVPVKSRKSRVTRIPDKPTSDDMMALGAADDGPYNEKKFGLIVLDELGSWLNARAWNDKSRKGFIEWCIHARKLRWDVYFLVQDIMMVDAQLRAAMCEYLVVCRRTDRMKIPGTGINMPKMHVASVYYGDTPQKDFREEVWMYMGKELYAAYDTTQSFSMFYEEGLKSVLPLGYWYQEPKQEGTSQQMKNMIALTVILLVGALIYNGYKTFTKFKGGMFADDTTQSTGTTALASASGRAQPVPVPVSPGGSPDQPEQHYQSLEPLAGFRYVGYYEFDAGITVILQAPNRAVPLEADSGIMEQLGYEIVSVDSGRLIAMYDGTTRIFWAQ